MNCLSPIWIEPTPDVQGGEVPCGKCYPCLQGRRNVWTFRMLQETSDAESAYFVTLTYDEDNVPLIDQYNFTVPSLHRPDLTTFLKRLREKLSRDEDKPLQYYKTSKNGSLRPKMRYFACGEYGTKGDRPHYHVIIWNLPNKYINFNEVFQEFYSNKIEDIWNKGFVDVGTVTQRSCHYVAKYTLDSLVNNYHYLDNRERAFATMSRKPGIGLNYVTADIKKHYRDTDNGYALMEGGYRQSLGRYLKEKVYEDLPQEEAIAKKAYQNSVMYDKADREEAKITRGLSREEATKRYEEFKRITRKEQSKKAYQILKGNKL